jgi:cobalt/nickel transport system permease protein
MQTTLSGISSLPTDMFLLLMLPIHLAIGLVEGAATVAVVRFIERMQPALLRVADSSPTLARPRVLVSLIAAAVLAGGMLSWSASEKPDGLEWSIANAATTPIESPQNVAHRSLADVQKRAALLPDYNFASEPARAGTSLAGLAGGTITLVLIALIAVALKRRR